VAETLDAGVAVVGAGPAGLAAACHAAEAGAHVVLLDEAPLPGGQIWRQGAARQPHRAARPWLERLGRSSARLVPGAAVVDAEAGPTLVAEREGRALRVRAQSLVLATGARELFLPFPGWTLPGVQGVGGAQALLKAGASFAGLRVVIAGSGPLLLPVAASLARAGARLQMVAEQAPAAAVMRFAAALWRRPRKLAEAALYRAAFLGTRYRLGTWLCEARGDERVREAVLTDGRRRFSLACDALACAYGLVANLELPRLLGCAVANGSVLVDEVQRTTLPAVFCAGEATGVGGSELALREGAVAGLAAAGRTPPAALLARRDAERGFARALEEAFAPRAELRRVPDAGTTVCRCESVAFERFDPGWGARRAKLYTRAGMGPCQGRVCGPALEFLFGWPADRVRPPLKPVPLGTLEDQA
jgi:D-hydroxyproline dehydrogenase subunit alpha